MSLLFNTVRIKGFFFKFQSEAHEALLPCAGPRTQLVVHADTHVFYKGKHLFQLQQ